MRALWWLGWLGVVVFTPMALVSTAVLMARLDDPISLPASLLAMVAWFLVALSYGAIVGGGR